MGFLEEEPAPNGGGRGLGLRAARKEDGHG
jgi:hypothetical protein